jgi:hypothetical protein
MGEGTTRRHCERSEAIQRDLVIFQKHFWIATALCASQ